MAYIDRILQQLESHIVTGTYSELEADKIEIKDLSSSDDWTELYKSVCAFLNTEGGIIVVGIREKNKQYLLSGYNAGNEDKLKELHQKFTDKEGTRIALDQNFPAPKIREFMDKRICLVYVEKLPEDQKYAFFKGVAYERKMTGDHKIDSSRIARKEEQKEELKNARELKIVEGASLQILDLDRLNDYINKLNREVKVESLKVDIPSALPFLTRKNFVRQETPTLLGVLLCGNHPSDWVGGRCQVDCYVDSEHQIAQNKQVLKDNIIPLMESAVGFVFKNIAVGVGYEGGGTSLPEYPDKLIREIVNNALAHRDYSSDKFSNIIIKPDTWIRVSNPGSFREDQKLFLEQPVRIRRIIPNPKPRNPNLADILKVYDRWEGRGLGMASLTNACLKNQIDVPYFLFQSKNDISLYVPKGKVLDDDARLWLTSFSGWIYRQTNGRGLSEEEETVLTYFYKSEQHNNNERYTILLTPDNNHFDVIRKLENYGLISVLEYEEQSIYPLFIVNPILKQKDFYPVLRTLFGSSFDLLKTEYKSVLQTIYLHNEYSLQSAISAKAVDIFLYTSKHKVVRNLREYDTYSRKVRTIVNKLEKKGFIERADGKSPRFVVNKNFARTPSLFDPE
ncbi:MAG: putative DNA binding domain-containing protein [Bacteroidia bacterium]|nr:putative DNA binding domain-containing protein [Bacteroidia bacterium]